MKQITLYHQTFVNSVESNVRMLALDTRRTSGMINALLAPYVVLLNDQIIKKPISLKRIYLSFAASVSHILMVMFKVFNMYQNSDNHPFCYVLLCEDYTAC